MLAVVATTDNNSNNAKYDKLIIMKNRTFRLLCFFPFLLLFANLSYSQDSTAVKKKLPFRITIGWGIGNGYPFQDADFGVGGTIEFAVVKNNTVYAIGGRTVEEFTLFNNSNVNKSISSYDLTVGKIMTHGKIFTSISTGVGLVRGLYPGKLISREGAWLFGYYTYEKKWFTDIGIPVSIKGIWVPGRVYGLGFELFVNFNTKNIFYGVNFSHQFGRLNPKQIDQKYFKDSEI